MLVKYDVNSYKQLTTLPYRENCWLQRLHVTAAHSKTGFPAVALFNDVVSTEIKAVW